MTDRVNALLVTLERDVRDDDIQPLVDALKHFRGVAGVRLNVVHITDEVAQMRVRNELLDSLFSLLKV
jgi:hypothetical protein